MKKIVCLLALLAVMASCNPANKGFEQYWVISQRLDVFKAPPREKEVLGTLKFGDEVSAREPNLGAVIPKEWLEMKFGKGRGYVDRANLGDKATIDEMKKLTADIKESQVQGQGETGKKTPLRLGPSQSSKLIELMKKPAKVEIFERIVVDKESKGTPGKDIWYKVRLEDGRAGFVPDRIRLATPAELNQYTSIRKPVAWRMLGEKEDLAAGTKCKDYVVAYSSDEMPADVDFSRLEIYTCDLKSGEYGTSFAKGGFVGKLPLIVKDGDDGKKIIEVRQLAKNKPEKLLVQEYSFPRPINMIREYEIDVQ